MFRHKEQVAYANRIAQAAMQRFDEAAAGLDAGVTTATIAHVVTAYTSWQDAERDVETLASTYFDSQTLMRWTLDERRLPNAVTARAPERSGRFSAARRAVAPSRWR